MEDKTFTVYWRTGERQEIQGQTQAQAMSLAGYSSGAIAAVDFICEGNNEEYEWNGTTREWHKAESATA